jgi:hypothetical protein
MRLRWTPDGSLELAGNRVELHELHGVILATAAGPVSEARVLAQTDGDPTPYASFLSALQVRCTEGPLLIRVTENSELEAAGGAEALRGLVSFLEFGDDESDGAHSHVQFYDGHPFISPSSQPLVVSLELP